MQYILRTLYIRKKITNPPEEDLSNIAAGGEKSFDLKDR